MNHYESTNFFRENTIHLLSLSRIRNLPPKFTMNPREEYKFTIFFAKSLWIHYLPRINYGFMIFFAKSLWIHYLCCEIILNSLLLMQIHRFFCEFIIFYIFSLLWLHYLLRQQTMYLLSFPLNHYLCRESTMNLLSLRDSIIVFPNVL